MCVRVCVCVCFFFFFGILEETGEPGENMDTPCRSLDLNLEASYYQAALKTLKLYLKHTTMCEKVSKHKELKKKTQQKTCG